MELRYVVLITWFLFFFLWVNAQEIPVYSDFEEMEHLLDKENDTTYVINFWATWCKPCVAELPYFEEVANEMAEDPVRFIFISLDFEENIKTKLIPFLEKRKFEYEVVVLADGDANSWIDKVAPEWSGAIPGTLIYRNDVRSFYERSFHDTESLKSIIQSFVN